MITIKNEYKGFLYKISDSKEECKGFILGSSHLMDEKKIKLGKLVKDSINNSKCLIVEMDFIEFAQEITDKTLKNPSLKNVVTLMNKIFMQGMGLHAGVDKKILEKAHKNKMIVHSLETVDKQLFIVEKQEGYLSKVNESKEVFNTYHDQTKTIIRTAKEGSKKQIKEYIDGLSESEKHEVFYKRNRKMAQKIDIFLKDNNYPFIVVGAGHLFGKEEGLLALLRKNGWKLSRIQQ